ncbi:MAG: hypothetical protein JSS02_34860 [Planctomycetes bacterium]|nr:hypothetical protein [Planctomycetota bacterium]
MESNRAIQFQYPLYSYLVEPGPRPAALRDSLTGTLYVPLWTDRDLFDAFVENFDFGGPICGLQIDDRYELTDFLGRFDHPLITQVAIDPDARAWIPFDLRDIDQVVRQINRTKPR